jgi:hypothetical protein
MKVGDYVRNQHFGIGRINQDHYDNNGKHWYNVKFVCYQDNDNHCGICEESVGFKTSSNIIDLIEEHDILKIEEQKGIYTICEVEAFREPYTEYDFLGVRLDNRPIARKLYELNIKSIVTKEQFESMEYRIGE